MSHYFHRSSDGSRSSSRGGGNEHTCKADLSAPIPTQGGTDHTTTTIHINLNSEQVTTTPGLASDYALLMDPAATTHPEYDHQADYPSTNDYNARHTQARAVRYQHQSGVSREVAVITNNSSYLHQPQPQQQAYPETVATQQYPSQQHQRAPQQQPHTQYLAVPRAGHAHLHGHQSQFLNQQRRRQPFTQISMANAMLVMDADADRQADDSETETESSLGISSEVSASYRDSINFTPTPSPGLELSRTRSGDPEMNSSIPGANLRGHNPNMISEHPRRLPDVPVEIPAQSHTSFISVNPGENSSGPAGALAPPCYSTQIGSQDASMSQYATRPFTTIVESEGGVAPSSSSGPESHPHSQSHSHSHSHVGSGFGSGAGMSSRSGGTAAAASGGTGLSSHRRISRSGSDRTDFSSPDFKISSATASGGVQTDASYIKTQSGGEEPSYLSSDASANDDGHPVLGSRARSQVPEEPESAPKFHQQLQHPRVEAFGATGLVVVPNESTLMTNTVPNPRLAAGVVTSMHLGRPGVGMADDDSIEASPHHPQSASDTSSAPHHYVASSGSSPIEHRTHENFLRQDSSETAQEDSKGTLDTRSLSLQPAGSGIERGRFLRASPNAFSMTQSDVPAAGALSSRGPRENSPRPARFLSAFPTLPPVPTPTGDSHELVQPAPIPSAHVLSRLTAAASASPAESEAVDVTNPSISPGSLATTSGSIMQRLEEAGYSIVRPSAQPRFEEPTISPVEPPAAMAGLSKPLRPLDPGAHQKATASPAHVGSSAQLIRAIQAQVRANPHLLTALQARADSDGSESTGNRSATPDTSFNVTSPTDSVSIPPMHFSLVRNRSQLVRAPEPEDKHSPHAKTGLVNSKSETITLASQPYTCALDQQNDGQEKTSSIPMTSRHLHLSIAPLPIQSMALPVVPGATSSGSRMKSTSPAAAGSHPATGIEANFSQAAVSNGTAVQNSEPASKAPADEQQAPMSAEPRVLIAPAFKYQLQQIEPVGSLTSSVSSSGPLASSVASGTTSLGQIGQAIRATMGIHDPSLDNHIRSASRFVPPSPIRGMPAGTQAPQQQPEEQGLQYQAFMTQSYMETVPEGNPIEDLASLTRPAVPLQRQKPSPADFAPLVCVTDETLIEVEGRRRAVSDHGFRNPRGHDHDAARLDDSSQDLGKVLPPNMALPSMSQPRPAFTQLGSTSLPQDVQSRALAAPMVQISVPSLPLPQPPVSSEVRTNPLGQHPTLQQMTEFESQPFASTSSSPAQPVVSGGEAVSGRTKPTRHPSALSVLIEKKREEEEMRAHEARLAAVRAADAVAVATSAAAVTSATMASLKRRPSQVLSSESSIAEPGGVPEPPTGVQQNTGSDAPAAPSTLSTNASPSSITQATATAAFTSMASPPASAATTLATATTKQDTPPVESTSQPPLLPALFRTTTMRNLESTPASGGSKVTSTPSLGVTSSPAAILANALVQAGIKTPKPSSETTNPDTGSPAKPSMQSPRMWDHALFMQACNNDADAAVAAEERMSQYLSLIKAQIERLELGRKTLLRHGPRIIMARKSEERYWLSFGADEVAEKSGAMFSARHKVIGLELLYAEQLIQELERRMGVINQFYEQAGAPASPHQGATPGPGSSSSGGTPKRKGLLFSQRLEALATVLESLPRPPLKPSADWLIAEIHTDDHGEGSAMSYHRRLESAKAVTSRKSADLAQAVLEHFARPPGVEVVTPQQHTNRVRKILEAAMLLIREQNQPIVADDPMSNSNMVKRGRAGSVGNRNGGSFAGRGRGVSVSSRYVLPSNSALKEVLPFTSSSSSSSASALASTTASAKSLLDGQDVSTASRPGTIGSKNCYITQAKADELFTSLMAGSNLGSLFHAVLPSDLNHFWDPHNIILDAFRSVMYDPEFQENTSLLGWIESSWIQLELEDPARTLESLRSFIPAFIKDTMSRLKLPNLLEAPLRILVSRLLYPRVVPFATAMYQQRRDVFQLDITFQRQVSWMRELTLDQAGINRMFQPLTAEERAELIPHDPMLSLEPGTPYFYSISFLRKLDKEWYPDDLLHMITVANRVIRREAHYYRRSRQLLGYYRRNKSLPLLPGLTMGEQEFAMEPWQERDDYIGGDDFFPIFVYVICQSELTMPHSQLNYMDTNLAPELGFHGECGMAWSTFASAILSITDTKINQIQGLGPNDPAHAAYLRVKAQIEQEQKKTQPRRAGGKPQAQSPAQSQPQAHTQVVQQRTQVPTQSQPQSQAKDANSAAESVPRLNVVAVPRDHIHQSPEPPSAGETPSRHRTLPPPPAMPLPPVPAAPFESKTQETRSQGNPPPSLPRKPMSLTSLVSQINRVGLAVAVANSVTERATSTPSSIAATEEPHPTAASDPRSPSHPPTDSQYGSAQSSYAAAAQFNPPSMPPPNVQYQVSAVTDSDAEDEALIQSLMLRQTNPASPGMGMSSDDGDEE